MFILYKLLTETEGSVMIGGISDQVEIIAVSESVEKLEALIPNKAAANAGREVFGNVISYRFLTKYSAIITDYFIEPVKVI